MMYVPAADSKSSFRKFLITALAVLGGFNLLVASGVYAHFKLTSEESYQQNSSNWRPLRIEPAGEIDLGDVPVNRETRFTALLHNTSSEPVSVTRIATTCGCTDAQVEPTLISPGQTAMLKGKIGGRSHPGRFGVALTLSLSGAESGRIGHAECRASVRVTARLELSATAVELRPSLYADRPDSVSVEASNLSNESLTVTVNPALSAGVSVTPSSLKLKPSGSGRLVVSAIPTDDGESRGAILLSAGHGEGHTISVRIRPRIGVTITPPVLSLGMLRRENGRLESDRPPVLTLSGPLVEEGHITVVAPPPLADPSVIKGSGGNTEVRFAMDDGWNGRSVRGTVRITVGSATGPTRTLEVPVVGYSLPNDSVDFIGAKSASATSAATLRRGDEAALPIPASL